jgi:hypothetical protein
MPMVTCGLGVERIWAKVQPGLRHAGCYPEGEGLAFSPGVRLKE